MSDKTGGPAYPVPYTDEEGDLCYRGGQTMRDHFATAALQGMLVGYETRITPERAAALAADAYVCAAAMLKAREE